MKTHPLHEMALKLSTQYLLLESKLIDLLQQIEREKIHFHLGYRSLFQYCTEALKLAENQAYTLIGVSRKCVEVPSLKVAIHSGVINASKAKRILPVITDSNSADWIAKAQTLPQRELEREVAKENPECAIREGLRPVSQTQSELRTQVSPKAERTLARVKELVEKKLGRYASWEEVITEMGEEYLKRNDPLRVKPSSPKKQALQRDQASCQEKLPETQKACGSRHKVEVHHIKPKSEGGDDRLENLVTLCAFHHARRHDFEGNHWKSRRLTLRRVKLTLEAQTPLQTQIPVGIRAISKVRLASKLLYTGCARGRDCGQAAGQGIALKINELVVYKVKSVKD